jgi:hypothetical protein
MAAKDTIDNDADDGALRGLFLIARGGGEGRRCCDDGLAQINVDILKRNVNSVNRNLVARNRDADATNRCFDFADFDAPIWVWVTGAGEMPQLSDDGLLAQRLDLRVRLLDELLKHGLIGLGARGVEMFRPRAAIEVGEGLGSFYKFCI